MAKIFITLVILFQGITLLSQVVFEPTSSTGVYELLDELAGEKIVEVNGVVKPWSRKYIAEKLQQALEKTDQLNIRQEKEVHFYLNDYRLELDENNIDTSVLNIFPGHTHLFTSFNPLAFSYHDSLFALNIRPGLGMETFLNNNDIAFMSRLGLDGFGYYSKHLGVYARYSYHYENTTITGPSFLSARPGGVVDVRSDGSQSFNEFRWGLMYSWKWGAVGVVNDRSEWGTNYYGANILSGHAPVYTQIRLQLTPAKWFEFNYQHGWLGSDVVDSNRSYWNDGKYHEEMRPKYIAANMFTFNPIPYLNFSIGNSIIYSDVGMQPVYLIPFLFYRLADYELSGMSDEASSNSQMFFDISSRNIKHLHLFFSLFIDEFSMYRISDSKRHNFLGYKGGFRLSNWPIEKLSLIADYTYTLPVVYQHYISSTTFESNSYSFGHYMRDNSQDLYLALAYKPIRGLRIELSYNFAQHGNDYENTDYERSDEIPMLDEITWQKSITGLKVNYDILSNACLYTAVYFSNVQGFDVDNLTAGYYLNMYTPEMLRGETVTAKFGFKVGM